MNSWISSMEKESCLPQLVSQTLGPLFLLQSHALKLQVGLFKGIHLFITIRHLSFIFCSKSVPHRACLNLVGSESEDHSVISRILNPENTSMELSRPEY